MSQQYSDAIAVAASYEYRPETRYTQTLCEPGFYCSNGVKTPCPAGRYGATFGLSESFCTGSCAAGYVRPYVCFVQGVFSVPHVCVCKCVCVSVCV